MRILHEAILPATCYVAEAALWVGLGRVPRVLYKHSEYGDDLSEDTGDPRSSRAALDEDDSLIPFDGGFTEHEFSAMGIETDFERYAKVRRLAGVIFPNLLLPFSGKKALDFYETVRSYAEILAKDRPNKFLDKEALAPLGIKPQIMHAFAEDLDWADGVDKKCEAYIDIARTEVYRALSAGRLRAKGWTVAPGDLPFKDRFKLPMVAIDPSRWTYRNFDWDQCLLQTPETSYYAVQVTTSELFGAFPRPTCTPQPASLVAYPGCMIVDDGTESPSSPMTPMKAPRGRPPKGDGLIRTAVVNVFTARAKDGDLPDKAEALVQEVIDYVSFTFGEQISRSSVQGYLKLLPYNPARKRAG